MPGCGHRGVTLMDIETDALCRPLFRCRLVGVVLLDQPSETGNRLKIPPLYGYGKRSIGSRCNKKNGCQYNK